MNKHAKLDADLAKMADLVAWDAGDAEEKITAHLIDTARRGPHGVRELLTTAHRIASGIRASGTRPAAIAAIDAADAYLTTHRTR